MKDQETSGCLIWLLVFCVCIAFGGFFGWQWGFVLFSSFLAGLLFFMWGQ